MLDNCSVIDYKITEDKIELFFVRNDDITNKFKITIKASEVVDNKFLCYKKSAYYRPEKYMWNNIDATFIVGSKVSWSINKVFVKGIVYEILENRKLNIFFKDNNDKVQLIEKCVDEVILLNPDED